MFKKITLLLVVFAVPACATATYMYDNVNYPTRVQALAAVNKDIRWGLEGVDISPEPIAEKIRIVMPNRELTEKYGVQKDALTPRDSIEYVRDVLYRGNKAVVTGVRRSNLFKQVEFVEVDSTFNPPFGSSQYMLLLHAPSFGKFQWYLLTKQPEARIPLSIDQAALQVERLQSFLDNLVIAMRSTQPEGSGQREFVQSEPEVSEESSGTGFVISKNGHILTNNHVTEDCKTIRVELIGQEPKEASLVAHDPRNDLAVLQAELRSKNIASFRNHQNAVKHGETVVVFGFPYGGILSSGGNFSQGNVSALSGLGDDSRFYQISAPVQSGNSGGPLIDEYGGVVGVVTSKLDALKVASVTGDVPQNINFAIKSSVAEIFLSSHSIPFTRNTGNKKLALTQVADFAQDYTAKVLCY